MKLSFIDAHVHLQMIEGVEQQLALANDAGVVGFICNATCQGDWEAVLGLAKKYTRVFPCLGIHPAFVHNASADWRDKLGAILGQNPHVMVGEIGLDKLKGDIDLQIDIFTQSLHIAHEYQRPCHIHCVRMWEVMGRILKENKRHLPPKILFHSHHGDYRLIKPWAEKYNAYFSYSSRITLNNQQKTIACLNATPDTRLLIESDAPGLTPSPQNLPNLAHQIATLCQQPLPKTAKTTLKNTLQFLDF